MAWYFASLGGGEKGCRVGYFLGHGIGWWCIGWNNQVGRIWRLRSYGEINLLF